MRIVFMGTPDFAEAHLRALLEQGFDICGVFTQPDKPRNRMKVSFSPVKETAIEYGIPVYQPTTLKDGMALNTLKMLEAELLIVVAYGKILPADFIAYPPLGCINVHASILPKYRGSAPIQWAVLNGDRTTGVTTMYVEYELDAGDIIYQQETEIGEFETSGELFDRLRGIGIELLCRTVRDIESGTAPRLPQDKKKITFTTQLSKEMCPIDWSKTPREIVKWICGLDPWPVATMELGGETVRVFKAEYTNERSDKAAGSVVSAGKQGIGVVCGDGSVLLITELQAAGSKRMCAHSYLLGHPVELS